MANSTFPDGTPRRGPDDMGSVGGVAPNGQAIRHADGTQPPPERLGGLNGVKGVIGGPTVPPTARA
jgi:hypothetical protein